ncbi:MAG: HypC/HybG/HupF family hydrogenase formation chaperone [Gaiellaceae bacterium MAG52_C11]|nr:HypC/HybG/HupF family hydrogenase formation chaperone [Candidatus Gaiellasilicea maunaloa]
MRKIEEREQVLSAFLELEQERLALACHALARAFSAGGTLVACGTGAAATDAAHVAVEFMHPVIVGKRALPAVAAPELARPNDIALGLVHGGRDLEVEELLARPGLLTIAFTGPEPIDADFSFSVASDDRAIVQEVQETAYHVLWELVHVFFEHPGLLADACITCGDVAVEARIVAISNQTATIERDGAREQVAIELVEGVTVGDTILCHAGVALERVD